MPTLSYTDVWRHYGCALRTMLDGAEQFLRAAAEDYQGTQSAPRPILESSILQEQGDVPEVMLEWRSDDELGRAVHVVVMASSLDVSEEFAVHHASFGYQVTAVAWKDNFADARRYWWQKEVGRLGVTSAGEALTALVREAIEAARNVDQPALQRWDLLPPLPPDLSEAERATLLAGFTGGRHRPKGRER